MDEPVRVPTVFSKNRDRLLEGEIAAKFFAQVLQQARAKDLLSDEHFSVDGHADRKLGPAQKSFQRKDDKPAPPPEDPGNSDGEFSMEKKRSNDTHESDDRSRGAAGAKEFWGTSRSWLIAETC